MTALALLQRGGALRALDVEFARLIARLDPHAGDVLALAAAAASQAVAQGHSCLPLAALGEVLAAAADEPPRIALPDLATLRAALAASPLVGTVHDTRARPLVCDGERLWLRRYFDHERSVAAALLARSRALQPRHDIEALRARLARWFPDRDAPDWQAVAVALGLRARLAVISGGPGTGKTATVLWLLAALLEDALAQGAPLPRIRLAAPTGKAAMRLGESIRARKRDLDCVENVRSAIREDEASTIHRLLGYRPHAGFRHDRANPLAADVVVVDEASMIDLPLMAHLLDALRDDATLILLGDVDQLASVEAGHVLAAIGTHGEAANRYGAATAGYLRSATGSDVPLAMSHGVLADAFVELRHSHRFGGASGIGRLATAIRSGDAADALAVLRGGAADVHWQPLDRVQLGTTLREHWLAGARAIGRAASAVQALAIADRFRILTALRDGAFGALAINRALEEALGNGADWYGGRLVMIGANDYRHNLFNGDVGVAFAAPGRPLEVWFAGTDGALRAFAPGTLPAHESAFAMTVHKSQGSEFDEVAVVLPDAAHRVLGRELLYTAVTRARGRVVVHGSEDILRATIARRIQRYSGLRDRLRDG
jgi:exodeoxyribonuclease V alpha subunit